MTITVALGLDNPTPKHGDTITAKYTVTGNDGTPAGDPQTASLTGDVTIGGDTLHAVTTLTLPGTPAVPPLSQSFAAPTAAGLTFTATSDPAVFTAKVP